MIKCSLENRHTALCHGHFDSSGECAVVALAHQWQEVTFLYITEIIDYLILDGAPMHTRKPSHPTALTVKQKAVILILVSCFWGFGSISKTAILPVSLSFSWSCRESWLGSLIDYLTTMAARHMPESQVVGLLRCKRVIPILISCILCVV